MEFKDYTKQSLKIAVIGGGNIGRVLSVFIDSLGHDVRLVASRDPKSISIDNYCMYNISGDFGKKSHLVRLVDSIENLDDDHDIIFICTKLFDGMEILRRIRRKLKPTGAIVTIQNTFWIDRASTQIPPKNAVFMCLDFACIRDNDRTRVLDRDGVKLGIIHKDAYPPMQMVYDVLKDFCKVQTLSDIIGFVLGRNIINIAIALLGGITGLNLGEALGHKKGKEIFIDVIKEGMNLFDSFGVKVHPYNNQLNYYLFREDSHKGKAYRKRIIKVLRKNNYNVSSSILYDLQRGDNSEIITVVKTFIKHAQQRKIKVPHIIALYTMIMEIKQGLRRIEENAFDDEKLKIK